MKHYYAHTLDVENDELLEKLRSGKSFYDSKRILCEELGVSKETVIENTLLNYAYSFEPRLNAPEYAVRFINILQHCFDKKKIMKLFPEGSVFKKQFQWLENTVESDYEFYYGGDYFVYHHGQDNHDEHYIIKAKSYHEMKVRQINQILRGNKALKKNNIKSITVFPTLYCDLQCPICLFASPIIRERKDSTMYLSGESLNKALELINSYPGVDLVIGGGGEPFLEKESVFKLISFAGAEKIKIYTNGNWGTNKTEVNKTFLRLYRALKMRKKPISVELNISVDQPHIRQISKDNDTSYLENILETYINVRKRGRLENILLHLRGLSSDGCIPNIDDTSIAITMNNLKSRHPEYDMKQFSRGSDGICINVSNGIEILASYNKLMRRDAKCTQRVIEEIESSENNFMLDRILINGDSSVNLGAYYKAVPLGNLQDYTIDLLTDLSFYNLLSEAVRIKGIRYLRKLAVEYDPDISHVPLFAATQAEFIKNLTGDAGRQLYLYYRVIGDFIEDGVLDAGILDKIGLDKTMGAAELRQICKRGEKEILTLEKTKKLNWGLSIGTSCGEPPRFRNLWWDVQGDTGRKKIIDNMSNIKNIQRIKSFVEDTLCRKYSLESVDITSIRIIGGYVAGRPSNIPVNDLDIIVIVKNPGIRDFIHESAFIYGDTFDEQMSEAPRYICVWMISEEFLSSTTDNIIDIDLGLTALGGMQLYGNCVQSTPPPIIERVKQIFIFLNLILKMASAIKIAKIYGRKVEIDAIREQLRVIADSSDEELMASQEISKYDKIHLTAVQNILNEYLRGIKKVNIEQEWMELSRLYALDNKTDEQGNRLDEDLYTLMASVRKRKIIDEISSQKKAVYHLIYKLHKVQGALLDEMPLQKPREWLTNIFKANMAFRSLEEHSGILKSAYFDYSTAVSLANITPYPTVLEKLCNRVHNADLSASERGTILAAIAGNPCAAPVLQEKIYQMYSNDEQIVNALKNNYNLSSGLETITSSQGDTIVELLLPKELNIPSRYSRDIFDFLVNLNCAGEAVDLSREKILARKGELIRKNVDRLFLNNLSQLLTAISRYAEIYNKRCINHLGVMEKPKNTMTVVEEDTLKEQLTILVTIFVNRILYSHFNGLPLYLSLDDKQYESIIEKTVKQALKWDEANVLFPRNQNEISDIISDANNGSKTNGPIRIGAVSFKDREGPSVCNRFLLTTMHNYLTSNGFSDIDFCLYDLQFCDEKELLDNYFDILIVDVRQENFAAFRKAMGEWPIKNIADHILFTGTYLAYPEAQKTVRMYTKENASGALIVNGDSEPALLGLVEHVSSGNMPLLLIPNIVFQKNGKEFVTRKEKVDLSKLSPDLYPFIEQMKESEWFNYYIETSRGCHYGECTFCSDKFLFGKGWRSFSMEYILHSFELLKKSGVHTVFICDKDFWGGDYERAEKIACGLVKMGNKVRYTVALRSDEIIEGEHLLDLFKESGMSHIFLGSEAFEDTALRRFNKGIDASINLEAIKILEEHKIGHSVGFIVDPLNNVDELIESCEMVIKNKLWGRVSSFFNFLITKKGSGYEKMMNKLGLLGEFNEEMLSFKCGFKDIRMAVIAKSISECLKEVPRLSFIYIISKRRIALHTAEDVCEWEKYNKHFAMMQEFDLNMLYSLAQALRDNRQDRIAHIKREYVQNIKNLVLQIYCELNKEHMVSANILKYIEDNMRLKQEQLAEAISETSFNERVRMAYESTEKSTVKMIKEGLSPQPYPVASAFNLSIASGAKDISGNRCDIPPSTIELLEIIAHEFFAFLGDAFQAMPSGRCRISLFNLFVNEENAEWEKFLTNPDIQNMYLETVKYLQNFMPIKVEMKGIMLTNQGAVIAKGFVDTDTLQYIRELLSLQFPNSKRALHLDTPFIPITIGRVTKDISNAAARKLLSAVEAHSNDELGFIFLRNLVLQASSDLSGLKEHKAAQQALEMVNIKLLEKKSISVKLIGFSNLKHFTNRNNLAIENLAGDLRGEFGKEVSVDLTRVRSHEELLTLKKKITREEIPDIIGLSVHFDTMQYVDEFVKYIQRMKSFVLKKPLLVFGNQIPTYLPDTILHKYPDGIVVRGEGEEAMRKLIEFKRGNISMRDIPNIAYTDKVSGKVIYTQVRPADTKLLIYPPSMDTVDETIMEGGNIMLQTGRGCSWGMCSFCAHPSFINGGEYPRDDNRRCLRRYNIDRVMKNFEALYAKDVYRVEIVDEDQFIAGRDSAERERLEDIIEGLKKLQSVYNKTLKFSVFVRPNVLYRPGDSIGNEHMKRLLNELREIGLEQVFLSADSGSQSQLNRYSKGIALTHIIGAIQLLEELKINIKIGFILFDPELSIAEILENIQFYRKHQIMKYNQWPFRSLDVFAGAPVAEILKGKGLLGKFNKELLKYDYSYADMDVEKIAKIIAELSVGKDIFFGACRRASLKCRANGLV
ncbi:MAG: radical SAM protein, partial [Prevotellaceae bacterium]|nr:radical SAM protein [Prevotellaceae bacterium]